MFIYGIYGSGDTDASSVEHTKHWLPARPGDMDNLDEDEPLEALRPGAKSEGWIPKRLKALSKKGGQILLVEVKTGDSAHTLMNSWISFAIFSANFARVIDLVWLAGFRTLICLSKDFTPMTYGRRRLCECLCL